VPPALAVPLAPRLSGCSSPSHFHSLPRARSRPPPPRVSPALWRTIAARPVAWPGFLHRSRVGRAEGWGFSVRGWKGHPAGRRRLGRMRTRTGQKCRSLKLCDEEFEGREAPLVVPQHPRPVCLSRVRMHAHGTSVRAGSVRMVAASVSSSRLHNLSELRFLLRGSTTYRIGCGACSLRRRDATSASTWCLPTLCRAAKTHAPRTWPSSRVPFQRNPRLCRNASTPLANTMSLSVRISSAASLLTRAACAQYCAQMQRKVASAPESAPAIAFSMVARCASRAAGRFAHSHSARRSTCARARARARTRRGCAANCAGCPAPSPGHARRSRRAPCSRTLWPCILELSPVAWSLSHSRCRRASSSIWAASAIAAPI